MKFPEYDEAVSAGVLAGKSAGDIAREFFGQFGLEVTANQVDGRITRLGIRKPSPKGGLRPPTLEQVFKNHIKVARAAIRLKHSIAADNELAQLLPELRTRLEARLQRGQLPSLNTSELLGLIEGKR